MACPRAGVVRPVGEIQFRRTIEGALRGGAPFARRAANIAQTGKKSFFGADKLRAEFTRKKGRKSFAVVFLCRSRREIERRGRIGGSETSDPSARDCPRAESGFILPVYGRGGLPHTSVRPSRVRKILCGGGDRRRTRLRVCCSRRRRIARKICGGRPEKVGKPLSRGGKV